MPDEIRKPTFEVVRDDVPEKPAHDLTMLRLALSTLSQRAIAAVADLFTLVTIGSTFWLYMSIHEPNTYQLVEIGMYSVFVLSANWIVRRK